MRLDAQKSGNARTSTNLYNRHITNKRCETRKLEAAQSTLAKLVNALFEMERIFQEKDGEGKTPLFVSRGRGGGGIPLYKPYR